jgi:hypothetical protein
MQFVFGGASPSRLAHRIEMSVTWTIDPEDRMIVVIAEGDVTRAEVDAMLDAIESDEILTYRRLFDGTKADTKMPVEDLIALGVRMRGMHVHGGMGPLAVVVPADKEEILERLFGMLAVPKRPMRVFNDADQGRRWIRKQLPGSRD